MTKKAESLKKSIDLILSKLERERELESLRIDHGYHLEMERADDYDLNNGQRFLSVQPQEMLGRPLGIYGLLQEVHSAIPTIISNRVPTQFDKGVIGQVWAGKKPYRSGNVLDANFKCTAIENHGNDASYKWEPLEFSAVDAGTVRYHFSADRSCEFCHMRMTNDDRCLCRTTMRCSFEECNELIVDNKPCFCRSK